MIPGIRDLKEVEYSGKPNDPMYFRFTNHTIDHTEAHANGEVNVDIDPYNEVVGIELLSGDAENFAVFWDIVKSRRCSK